MSCGVAIKRPLDLSQDSFELVDVKRPRHNAVSPQCTMFRPQLNILASSLNQTSVMATPNSSGAKRSSVESPFAEVAGRCQLSTNQLDSYLRAEIQYLKRRKLIPRRPLVDATTSRELENSTANFRKAQSPVSSNSGSDSEGENTPTRPSGSDVNVDNKKEVILQSLYEKPQFSLRQVKLICERLLKEQEMRLRYEYETILNKKLEEQHDQYVQFAKEQLDANAAQMGNEISYLS